MKSNYETKKYILQFTELGNYESLEYWFETIEEAKEKLRKLSKGCKKYFCFIAEVKLVVRVDD